jgi:hypothetical protein
VSGDDVTDAELGEDCRLLTFGLIAFNLYFIVCYFLPLLPKDADDVHRCARGEAERDQLGRFWTGVAGGCIDEDVMTAIVRPDPLHAGTLWVCEFDLYINHP